MTTLALVGNPNCGKTTVFNALTGAHQRVGNWPGVTVEQKTGNYQHAGQTVTVVDLPGLYSLTPAGDAIDERVARDYLASDAADVIVNVIDAASLGRGLLLTTELLELARPLVVVLNMMDVADSHGQHIDVALLSQTLGVPVVPLIASRREGVDFLRDAVHTVSGSIETPHFGDLQQRFQWIDGLLGRAVQSVPVARTLTERLDAIVLNRFLAFPLFLGVMYLLFLFTINVGGAFIDLFDGLGHVLFVAGPAQLLTAVGSPAWLTTLLADGVGGGIQLVGTFIPIIAFLFLALAFLEDSGYMGRVAFIIDALMRRLGLPGKSFVPLIVGFGCNVPAVMATRTLDNEPDRILTTIMAPYMSCGARLTVYALFAAAFFPDNGQNVVFALYLLGIAVAVLSALVVRRHLLPARESQFMMELPAYHWPTLRGLAIQTWLRLRSFVMRAGKAIVAVVVVLNLLNSVGTDGSFGNQNSQHSVLSAIGKTLTPAFAPMGIQEDNWPATVGIFTGFFAKEVVVGTLDALYSPDAGAAQAPLGVQVQAALATVPDNLRALTSALADPLGLDLGPLDDTAAVAAEQEISVSTLTVLQSVFDGTLGAFSYLVFILLYMPCVATIGAIYKELGAFWAGFSSIWSLVSAYTLAVICYQGGQLATATVVASGWILGMVAIAALGFFLLIRWGQQRRLPLIPVVHLD